MDITITFTSQEQAALVQLLDVALRAVGLGALDVAVHFKQKLDSALLAARAEDCAR
jgi:hypothetical protein